MLRRRLVPLLFGIALVFGLVLLRAADPYPVAALREIAFDAYQRAVPRQSGGFPIRVVDIDEASLAEIGQWPWPRDRLALMVDRLTDLGAAAVGFDALFPEADRMSPSRIAATIPGVDAAALPDYDAIFARALGQAPAILGFARSPFAKTMPGPAKAGFAISGPDPKPSLPLLPGAVIPLPELYAAAPGFGALSLRTEDAASAVRRLPLVWTDGTALLPSFSIESLRVAMGLSTIVVMGDLGQPGRMEALRLGDFTVPTTAEGDLLLYYREPDRELYVPARDMLADDFERVLPLIEGHIVLIGTSASGLLDLHTTTLGDNVPGVSIHAEAIDQILAGDHLIRNDWVAGLEMLLFAGFGLVEVVVILWLGPLAGLIGALALVAGTAGYSWLLFTNEGLLVDATFPLAGIVMLYAVMVFFQFLIADADKRQIRRAFGYYVSPTLLTQIEQSGEDLKLGGDLREITVMFSDVRGFTPLSERLGPVPLLGVLNTLFTALGRNIVDRFGTIDKFIGDAIMAFWNAPVDVKDHACRACESALGMRRTLAELNANDAFGLKPTGGGVVSIGIGIATGEAVVGNMGLDTRFDYSCIGDTVNVASRVEGASKAVGYDIVVVESTRAAAAQLAFLEAGSVQLKGKSARLVLYLLVGDAALAASADFAELAAAHSHLLDDLRAGRDETARLARCIALCESVEPTLKRFYETIAERREDFYEPSVVAA